MMGLMRPGELAKGSYVSQFIIPKPHSFKKKVPASSLLGLFLLISSLAPLYPLDAFLRAKQFHITSQSLHSLKIGRTITAVTVTTYQMPAMF